METTSHRARKRREELGLTQRQVAQACNVSQQAYEKFESGATKRPRYIFELSKALNVAAEWLLTGKSSENPEGHPARRGSKSQNTVEGIGGVPVYSYLTHAKTKKAIAFDQCEVIDRITPLPGLENTTGAIALYIQGDDLEHVYPHGTMLYLDRNRYPSKNKPCVCICAEGIRILIYLNSAKDCHYFKFMDSGKETSLKARDVKALYRIAGVLYG